MSQEIGSDFWETPQQTSKDPSLNRIKNLNNCKGFLSGRSALDYIIKDISIDKSIRTVLLPSYCCQTMIMPFILNGIKVFFYDVFPAKDASLKLNIDSSIIPDLFVNIDYFGFFNNQLNDTKKKLKKLGTIIIDDKTQSLFSNDIHLSTSDYSFSSLRKWFAISDGALLWKHIGDFKYPLPVKEHSNYVNTRLNAFNLKADFIIHKIGVKKNYLQIYHDADNILKQDYIGYRMSSIGKEIFDSLDISQLKKKRKENAVFLIDELKDIHTLQLIYKSVHNNETPLFLPVLVKNGFRDALQTHLISKKIYCPKHWPLSEFHKISDNAKEVYNQELSIVCDQRYDITDMEKIIKAIRSFFKHN